MPTRTATRPNVNPFDKQIENRNFLSPVGFRFVLTKCPKVSFFSNSAQIPGLNISPAPQPTYLKDIPQVGDKMEFQDSHSLTLVIDYLVNGVLKRYLCSKVIYITRCGIKLKCC